MKLDWSEYTQVADNFQHKARFEDREDLRQDIIVRLAEVANKKTEPLTAPAMVRIASLVIMEYWRKVKAVLTTTSLNEEIDDGDNNNTELAETIADDRAIDLEAWVDARVWLRGCPRRLVKIAYKKVLGKALNLKERQYLCRYRQKELKKYQQKFV